MTAAAMTPDQAAGRLRSALHWGIGQSSHLALLLADAYPVTLRGAGTPALHLGAATRRGGTLVIRIEDHRLVAEATEVNAITRNTTQIRILLGLPGRYSEGVAA